MRLTRYALLAIALGLGGVVACGDSDSSDDRAETITPSSDDATADAEPADGAELATDAIDQALLTIDDMPTGYTLTSLDDDDDESAACAQLDSAIEAPAAEAEVAFTKGALGPFIVQVVGAFSSTSAAERSMKSFLEAIDQCQSWEEVDEDGEVSRYELSPMSFDTVGDQTVAVGMTIESEGDLGLSGAGAMVAFRRANVVELLVTVGVFNFDVEELAVVVAASDERLSSLMS